MDKGSSLLRRHSNHDLWLCIGFMKYFGLDENDYSDAKLTLDFLTRIKEIG